MPLGVARGEETELEVAALGRRWQSRRARRGGPRWWSRSSGRPERPPGCTGRRDMEETTPVWDGTFVPEHHDPHIVGEETTPRVAVALLMPPPPGISPVVDWITFHVRELAATTAYDLERVNLQLLSN